MCEREISLQSLGAAVPESNGGVGEGSRNWEKSPSSGERSGGLHLIRYNSFLGCYEWTSKAHKACKVIKMYLTAVHAKDLQSEMALLGRNACLQNVTREPQFGKFFQTFCTLLCSELRHVIWAEIHLLCNAVHSNCLDKGNNAEESLKSCMAITSQLNKRFVCVKAVHRSWDDLTGNIPEQFIDAQCPGLVANIRGKLKFLKDAFKEAVDQVSWALQRILSSQLPDCCVQSWLQALVLHLDLKSDLLEEFNVFSEILSGPTKKSKRMIGSMKFRTTVHTVSMVTGLMKRTSSANEDVNALVYEISTRLCKSPKINAWKLFMHFSYSRASYAVQYDSPSCLTELMNAGSINQKETHTGTECEISANDKTIELHSLCKKELALILNALKDTGDDKKIIGAAEYELDPVCNALAIGKSVSSQGTQSLGSLRSSGIIGTPAAMLFFPPKSPGLVPGSPTVSLSSFQASSALVHFLYSWFLHHLRGVRNSETPQINLGWFLLETKSLKAPATPQDETSTGTQDTSQFVTPETPRTPSNSVDSASQSFTLGTPQAIISEDVTESGAFSSLNSPKGRLPALPYDIDTMSKHKGIPLLQPLPTGHKQGCKGAGLPALSQESKNSSKHVLPGVSVTQTCQVSDKKKSPIVEYQKEKHHLPHFWIIPVVSSHTSLCSFIQNSLTHVESQNGTLLPSARYPEKVITNLELCYEKDRAVLYRVSKRKKIEQEETTGHMSQVAKLALDMLDNICECLKSCLMDNSSEQEHLLDCRIRLALLAVHVVQAYANWAVQWRAQYPGGVTLLQLCVVHSDILEVANAASGLLSQLYKSAELTSPPWMRRNIYERAAKSQEELYTDQLKNTEGAVDKYISEESEISSQTVEDSETKSKAERARHGCANKNQILPIHGDVGEEESTSAIINHPMNFHEPIASISSCLGQSALQSSDRLANKIENAVSSHQPRKSHCEIRKERIGPEYPSLAKKALRKNFLSAMAARRFKWRQKQCDVKREVEAHRKNIWLDYRETKVLRILNESVVQMKFHIGDLTDMMSQEFRIVSEDLWAVYPPRAWKLPAQPVDASRGAVNLVENFLGPLSNTLSTLHEHAQSTLLGHAFSASAHTVCSLVANTVKTSKHRPAKYCAIQLQKDVAIMLDTCKLRMPEHPPESFPADTLLSHENSLGAQQQNVMKRVNNIVEALLVLDRTKRTLRNLECSP